MEIHPLLLAGARAPGYTVDGRPSRFASDDTPRRIRLVPEIAPYTVEFVAEDVPPFGWRRFRLRPSADAHPDRDDDGRSIAIGDRSVEAASDGTLTVRFGPRVFPGVAAVENIGDRGDTYDFDAAGGNAMRLDEVRVHRSLHANGVALLVVERTLSVPAALAPDRAGRSAETVRIDLRTEARLVPGVARVDLRVTLHNRARDHRLRLLFPTGRPVEEFLAATTFDVARRSTAPRQANGWVHPAPSTFPHQGFVSAGGFTVVAPGLSEAEVTPDGVIAITLVRSVGWLSRMDLRSRPQMAGPGMPTPGAQCLETIEADLSLHPELDVRAASDAETGLVAVTAGDAPLFAAGAPLLEIEPRAIVLSAMKPAEDGSATIVRLLNPTDDRLVARLKIGLPVARVVPVRLDETPDGEALAARDGKLEVVLPAHALRSIAVEFAPR
jgi:2-O-(6-phospho-alpha-D-mannosyl)-D-glycerate hydrolase